jgi:hypothetical protein
MSWVRWATRLVRTCRSRSAASGLWQTPNPLGADPVLAVAVPVAAGVDVDLFDAQVVGHAAVAAGSGERGGGFGVGVAQLLGVDVVPAPAGQIRPVGRGAEPRSATHTSRRNPHPPRSSLTVRMIAVSVVSPGRPRSALTSGRRAAGPRRRPPRCGGSAPGSGRRPRPPGPCRSGTRRPRAPARRLRSSASPPPGGGPPAPDSARPEPSTGPTSRSRWRLSRPAVRSPRGRSLRSRTGPASSRTPHLRRRAIVGHGSSFRFGAAPPPSGGGEGDSYGSDQRLPRDDLARSDHCVGGEGVVLDPGSYLRLVRAEEQQSAARFVLGVRSGDQEEAPGLRARAGSGGARRGRGRGRRRRRCSGR